MMLIDRAAAIAALGGPEKARLAVQSALDANRRGSRFDVFQACVIADLALSALEAEEKHPALESIHAALDKAGVPRDQVVPGPLQRAPMTPQKRIDVLAHAAAGAKEKLAAAQAAADDVDRAGGDAPHEPGMGLAAWIRCRDEMHRRALASAAVQALDQLRRECSGGDRLRVAMQPHALAHLMPALRQFEVEGKLLWMIDYDQWHAWVERRLESLRADTEPRLECGLEPRTDGRPEQLLRWIAERVDGLSPLNPDGWNGGVRATAEAIANRMRALWPHLEQVVQ